MRNKQMKQAKSGDTVKVYFSGKLDDGTVFGSSDEKKPMQFVIGKNRVIQGLKEAVIGMSTGESKTTRIAADKAFGPHLESAVRVVNKKQCPSDIKLGQQLKMTDENVRTTIVKVIDISESKVTLDINHPLAGKDLTLDIKLLEIL
jgi:peptidylprolyl isomerase